MDLVSGASGETGHAGEGTDRDADHQGGNDHQGEWSGHPWHGHDPAIAGAISRWPKHGAGDGHRSKR
jgi:hypothetical protein